MASQLEKIPDDHIPTEDMDVREYWRVLAPLCHLLNAWLNPKIVTNSGRNDLKLTESNATLELDVTGGGGIAPPTVYVWNLFPSPWQGIGPDPHASDRARRFRILTATINGRTPTNPTDELVAFGNMDPLVAESDAVWTQVYARCPISESTLGTGDLSTERPTIMAAQGADLQDAGVQTPPFGADGSLPPFVIISLGIVRVFAGSIHFQQYYYESIAFALANGGGCELSARNFIVNGGTPGGTYYG